MSLYWLQQTINVLPLVLWVYIGMGIPFALLILPRQDWSQKMTVLALSFAFGAALLTAWMLILGTIGGTQERALLRFTPVFSGTVVIALIGYFLAWQKYRKTQATKTEKMPLAFDEKLLILLIVLAIAIRWLVTSYWSFTAYDALWVYGYEGRLFHILGYIPQDIGYYPQFVPLQYTFMQLLSNGFDDHAARAVIPFMHTGSILAAYVMGAKLFTRRAGIIAAAIWTLYPHVAQWAHIGDLEIPLTFALTLTMAFFLLAWTNQTQFLRRRYALIAGLCFGIAMWTKPTGGAFIWGVILLVAVEFLRVKFDWKQWLPRFEVAFITGLACIPLGGVWYLRNIVLGLPALVFPHESWLTRATRSGDLLSFPIFALLLLIAYLASTRKLQRGWVILAGVILLLAGAMPSSPLIDEIRRDPPMSYITWLEASLIISGAGLIAWGLWRNFRGKIALQVGKISWAYLLILPYFMTWFWSYSYHARLSFPIVPILILPIAVILAHWLPAITVQGWRFTPKAGWSLLLILLSIPAMITPIFGIAPTHDWLWTDRYPDDFSRTALHNPGVALLAEQLWGYADYHGTQAIVIAPGEQRLRFFMPDVTIISDTIPTTYEELNSATHFIYGSQARWRYENDENIDPLNNRVVASLGRESIFQQVLDFETGTFEFELYQLNLEARFSIPEGHLIEDEVIFGDAIRYVGDSLNNTQLLGNQVGIAYFWEVLAVPESDYLIQVDLLNEDDGQIYRTWQFSIAESEDAYYNTALWEIGEYVVSNHAILLDATDIPQGAGLYRFVVNFVDRETGELLPMTINSDSANGYPMVARFSVGQ